MNNPNVLEVGDLVEWTFTPKQGMRNLTPWKAKVAVIIRVNQKKGSATARVMGFKNVMKVLRAECEIISKASKKNNKSENKFE